MASGQEYAPTASSIMEGVILVEKVLPTTTSAIVENSASMIDENDIAVDITTMNTTDNDASVKE